MVYLIHAAEVRRVKVGVCSGQGSHAGQYRLRQLQTGSPVVLSLVGVLGSEDDYELERHLHARFADNRTEALAKREAQLAEIDEELALLARSRA